MPVDKKGLLDIINSLDSMLSSPMEVVLIGGSAITLLGLKEKSKDVAFFYGHIDDFELFGLVERLSRDYGGMRIDVWPVSEMLMHKEGRIVSQKLPSGYLDMCLKVDNMEFKYIDLRILNPIDIVLTKVWRLSEDDIGDITHLAEHYQLSQDALRERFELHKQGYDGDTRRYESNFKSLMEMLF
ncbi:hypothetical protein HY638_03500 [Candidatus Woesearchaeota archaeon]|nr:hypothetical protein [Candidatus Woesearchaeota archaeon]